MLKYLLIIPLIKSLYLLLLLLQQDKYKPSSIITHLFKYYFKTSFITVIYLSSFFLLKNIYIDIVIYLLIILVSLKPSKYILKLKYTKRMFRIILLILITLIPLIIIFNNELTYILIILFLPFILFVLSYLITPLELLINKYYKNKAIKKLKNINPFTITITGSFGKTSVKEILYEIYQTSYLTVKTPSSYNTPMGISKTILKDLKPLTEIFITEAGATKIGDIKELTKMLNPKIGIITSIGPQHLQTFKTMDNVLKTKWELASYMDQSSKVILNYQNTYLNGLIASNLQDTISVNTTTSSYYYKDVVITNDICEFDIYSNNKKQIHLKTKMIGLHNIENITLAYACVKTLEEYGYYIDKHKLKTIIYNLKNPPHRLSTRIDNINGVTFRYLDDSYNSNLYGFKSALNTLKHFEGIKVLITPGLVDTGNYSKELYLELIPNLLYLDEIIIIDNKSAQELISILREKELNYLLFKSLNQAINYILNKYKTFKDYKINILLENDLPDNYLMR